MLKLISKAFLKLGGWQIAGPPPKEVFEKCVMICAPHTSNWDYPIALAITSILGIKTSYAFKKEMMDSPLGPLLKSLGALSIDRTPKKEGAERPSTVQAIANLFQEHEKLCVMIAAEGSRSLRTEWKTGFYYIALQAKVPICLGYLDYKNKIGGFSKIVYPTGDIHADMKEIMDFFQDKTGKKPKQFSLDQRFVSNPATSEE